MRLPGLFQRFSIFKEGLSLSGHIGLVRIHKRDGLDITEANALWISITIIALHGDPFLDIKERMAKRTCHDAGPASNAQIFVDGHPIITFWFPVTSLGRANLHAVGFLAVIAGHGKV